MTWVWWLVGSIIGLVILLPVYVIIRAALSDDSYMEDSQ